MIGPNDNEVLRDAIRAASSPTHQPTRYARAITGYVSALRYPELAVRSAPTAPAERRPAHRLVVVGVHPNPASVAAVDLAVIEADLRGWGIRLVHVQPRGRHGAEWDAGGALLAHLVDRAHACSPRVAAVSRLCVGPPGPMLVREAAAAGLLVVGGTHGRIAAALGGAVAEHVTAHRRGPVLVVRTPAWPPAGEVSARPVVAGVDGSPGSRAALAFAADEARLRGAELVLLHATGDRSGHPPGEPLAAVPPEWLAGLTVHRTPVRGGAAHALLAASYEASALVVGSRGRGGPAGLLLGSVARSLLHGAHCPVFFIR